MTEPITIGPVNYANKTYTITNGNYLSGTWNGGNTSAEIAGTSYSYCVKLESTTSLSFTTTKKFNVEFRFTGTQLKINGTATSDAVNNVLKVTLEAGEHKIERNSGTTNLYSIIFSDVDDSEKSSECDILSVTAGTSSTVKDTYTGIKTGDEEWNVTIPYGIEGEAGTGDNVGKQFFYLDYSVSNGATGSGNIKKSLDSAAGKTSSQDIIVTAEDGKTQKTWRITLVRGAAPGYTVSYNLNNHGEAISDEVNATALPATFPTPTATGYDFKGWYTDEGLTNAAEAGVTISSNTTLYAKWTAQVYEIKYPGFDGTHGDNHPTRHTYGNATTLVNPTKDGYTFAGWYNNIDCTGSVITEIGAEQITANINLYAKWTENTETLNCTNNWWLNQSSRHALPTGQSMHLTFHNQSTNGNENFYNWILTAGTNVDGNTEYMALRADEYDIHNNGSNTTRIMKMNGVAVNWDTFKSDMSAGADVDIYVANSGSKLYVHAVTTAANGNKYDYTAETQSSAETAYISLMGEQCTLTNIKFYDPVTAYSVSAVPGTNCESATMTNALGMVVSNRTFVPSGEKITFTATTSDARNSFEGWKVGSEVKDTENPTTLEVTFDVSVTADYSAIEPSHEASIFDIACGDYAPVISGNKYAYTIDYSDAGTVNDGKHYYDITFKASISATVTTSDGATLTPNASGVYTVRKSLDTTAASTNSVTITVTAEDETTTGTYVIDLVRGPAPAIDGEIIWDYTETLPSKSPNNNLYYTQGTASDDNGQGIKVNGSAGIYFTKTGAGTLTLVYGTRKVGNSMSLNIYNNTSNESSLASDAVLVKTTQLSVTTGLTIETVELTAEQNNVYIKRAAGAEGVITKLIWTPNGTAYAITASATNGSVALKSGDYSVISGAKVPANTAVVATATPTDESYNFEGWTVNGNTSNATQTLNLTMDKDYTIVATFNKIEQQVSNLTKVNNNAIAFTYNDGQTYTLAKTTDYTTSSNGAITFTTSDATVATVDAEGKITPNNAGTATIILTQAETPEYKGSSVQFTVTVAAIEPTITVTDYIKHFTGQSIRTNLVSNSDGAFTITAASNAEKVNSEIDGRTLVTTGVSEDNQRTSVTITQAASGNYSEKAFTITLDCFAAPTVITEVLEVRGGNSRTFTNGVDISNVQFGNSTNYSSDIVSPLTTDLTSTVHRTSGISSLDITLNSSSAKEIVMGLKPGTSGEIQITVKCGEDVLYGPTVSNNGNNLNRYELELTKEIPQGSVITFEVKKGNKTSGSDIWSDASANFYYFEVTSKAEVYAPVITDNGNATGSMTSKTNGASFKYKALTEKLTTLPNFSSDDDSWKESTTGAITDLSTTNDKYYIYAVAIKNSKVSDVAEGIIAVETSPSLSCKPVAVTLNSDQSQTQAITTVATMNKQTVTGNYTYVYTSDKESVATVDGAGLITAVGPGSAKITISAKDNSDNVVATDEVIVVVTKDGLITPEFTWNGTQFDVVVNKTFNEKTPVAYNSVIRGDDTRYLDITNGYDITYFSSNGNATITNKGMVTGKALGQATITAVFTPNKEYQGSYNGGMATIIANVKEDGATPITVEVTNNPSVIDLSSDALTYQSAQPTSVKAGDVQLSAGKWFATYESDNWNVATVNETGLVTAKNVGTATVRVAYMPAQDGI